MGGFGYITASIVAAVALAGSAYTYWVMRQKEGVTQQELAPLLVTALVAAGGLVVALLNIVAYYTYYREDLKAWRDERRRQTGGHLHTTLQRLRNEQRNFEISGTRSPRKVRTAPRWRSTRSTTSNAS